MSWSDWFLPDNGGQTSSEQEANYARQQQILRERLAARQAAGGITSDSYYLSNMDPLASQDAAAWDGFKEGASEGWNNVLAFPGKVIDNVGGGILKNIPLWAWLAAGVALFFYLGGGELLRRKMGKL